MPLETLARFVTADVYPLELTGLTPGLYRGHFNYRKSARQRDALVLVREDGAFLLAGVIKACPLVGARWPTSFLTRPGERRTRKPIRWISA